MSQQDRTKGKARNLLEHSSSRDPSREDPSLRGFRAVAITAGREDTSHLSVGYPGQGLIAQDRIFAHLSRRERSTLISSRGAHLSRRRRADISLISFQGVEDPIDRVNISTSSSKAVYSRSRAFKHHVGYWFMSRNQRAHEAVERGIFPPPQILEFFGVLPLYLYHII